MRLITVFLACFILFLAQAAFASSSKVAGADFSRIKCLSPEETAQELLNIEASGRQHPDSTCMKQENFPRYKIGVRSSCGGDAPDKRKVFVLSGQDPYKIKSMTKSADGEYTVKFEYKLDNGKTILDQLSFVEYKSGELKSLFGCAGIIASPKTLVIHRACLP